MAQTFVSLKSIELVCKLRIKFYGYNKFNRHLLLQNVGCDGIIGSNETDDMCGVCGGNNSTCIFFRNDFDHLEGNASSNGEQIQRTYIENLKFSNFRFVAKLSQNCRNSNRSNQHKSERSQCKSFRYENYYSPRFSAKKLNWSLKFNVLKCFQTGFFFFFLF